MHEELVITEAGDWYDGLGDDDAQREWLGITADTTDDQLEEIAEQEATEYRNEGLHLIDGLPEYLEKLRDEVRAEQSDEY